MASNLALASLLKALGDVLSRFKVLPNQKYTNEMGVTSESSPFAGITPSAKIGSQNIAFVSPEQESFVNQLLAAQAQINFNKQHGIRDLDREGKLSRLTLDELKAQLLMKKLKGGGGGGRDRIVQIK